MTTAVSSSTSSAASSAAAGSNVAADTQDKFLNLLVAQLKNQDPLNPMDNAQMTSQIAQINTVDGITKLNATLQQLLGSYDTSQAMQATSLVGHSVLAAGTTLDLANGLASGGFELAAPADKVTVTVTGANGQVVHQANLSNLDSGVQSFQWDGMNDAGVAAAAGRYTFSVSAISNGQGVTVNPLALSHIDGVAGGGAAAGTAGTTFNTSTGSVTWSQVKQVM